MKVKKRKKLEKGIFIFSVFIRVANCSYGR